MPACQPLDDRPQTLQIATAFGLESVVSRELKDLGYAPSVVRPGRLRISADPQAICRTNLWLRAADRVLLEMAEFPADNFDTLFEVAGNLPWETWIPPNGAIHVVGKSLRSQLSSVPACQRTVKKAIVNRLLQKHQVDTLPETGETYRVEISIQKDIASLTLDTTGPSLHKRGYRRRAGEAPLKETLAAALVLLSPWKAGRPLIDPFCGSGTIPIEAGMIGRNMAPGLHRQFAAEEWPVLPAHRWETARQEARQAIAPPLTERVIGYDADPDLLELARAYADQVGLSDSLHFQARSFDELLSKREYGCVICNPPYGERLSEQEAVEELYTQLPLVLRRLPTWSHLVLTSHPHFERLVGRPADRRRKLYNGRIRCTYFTFFGPRPGTSAPAPSEQLPENSIAEADSQASPTKPQADSTDRPSQDSASSQDTPSSQTAPLSQSKPLTKTAPTGKTTPPASNAPATEPTTQRGSTRQTPGQIQPAFGGISAKSREQAELFRSRLQKRARHLRRWPTRQGITCYRLYDRDIPEIPLTVDLYEEFLHITEYERPHERSPAEHADWLDLMARTAGQVLEFDRTQVVLKRRRPQKGEEQYQRLAQQGRTEVVREGGLQFEINLTDYVDTGLFLDHRNTRAMVRDQAKGRHFLNLFCYTGSFTVYAADGGAASTTSVDRSSKYLDWAERNLALNQFEGSQHRLVARDVQTFLAQEPKRPTYDLAVVDPPTFSNRKEVEEDWIVQRDYRTLFDQLFPLMNRGGIIYFSTNYRQFKLSEPPFGELGGGCEFHEITRQTVPEDYRNKRIHRCWRLICP